MERIITTRGHGVTHTPVATVAAYEQLMNERNEGCREGFEYPDGFPVDGDASALATRAERERWVRTTMLAAKAGVSIEPRVVSEECDAARCGCQFGLPDHGFDVLTVEDKGPWHLVTVSEPGREACVVCHWPGHECTCNAEVCS